MSRKSDRSFVVVPTINNKYISGICKTCHNEYTDLKSHYERNFEHRVIEVNYGKNSRK